MNEAASEFWKLQGEILGALAPHPGIENEDRSAGVVIEEE